MSAESGPKRGATGRSESGPEGRSTIRPESPRLAPEMTPDPTVEVTMQTVPIRMKMNYGLEGIWGIEGRRGQMCVSVAMGMFSHHRKLLGPCPKSFVKSLHGLTSHSLGHFHLHGLYTLVTLSCHPRSTFFSYLFAFLSCNLHSLSLYFTYCCRDVWLPSCDPRRALTGRSGTFARSWSHASAAPAPPPLP